MLKKHPFLSGTIILTATGIISRIIGFFYRIFLSRQIGEEGMGIYQLIAPIMALSFSLTCAGIQTSISKYTAAYLAKKRIRSTYGLLACGFFISMTLSILTTIFLYQNSAWISAVFLLEPRCEPLIRIYALSLPFSCIHSCINGYYYGMKKSLLPSISQLIEQVVRVASVYAIYTYSAYMHAEPTIAVTMLGILLGEIAATFVSIWVIYHFFKKNTSEASKETDNLFKNYSMYTKEILSMAIPLSLNRLTLNFLQSIEAVQIPNCLMRYGLSRAESLSNYGVLTGMAFPLLFFPSALTSSVSILLLPYISEAGAEGNIRKIKGAIKKSVLFCILLGSGLCVFFLTFGKILGNLMFHSTLAGSYIQALSITCPFLYLGSVITSILNGLGKATQTFFIHVFSLLIRLAFVYFFIPQIGMNGYLIGIFVSEGFLISFMSLCLYRYLHSLKFLQKKNA